MQGEFDNGKGESEEVYYIAEKDLVGFEPDGPNYIEGVGYDDGSINVPQGTELMMWSFELYSIEFIMMETGKHVSLHRKRVCEDVSKPEYYDNYFAPVEGLKRIEK